MPGTHAPDGLGGGGRSSHSTARWTLSPHASKARRAVLCSLNPICLSVSSAPARALATPGSVALAACGARPERARASAHHHDLASAHDHDPHDCDPGRHRIRRAPRARAPAPAQRRGRARQHAAFALPRVRDRKAVPVRLPPHPQAHRTLPPPVLLCQAASGCPPFEPWHRASLTAAQPAHLDPAPPFPAPARHRSVLACSLPLHARTCAASLAAKPTAQADALLLLLWPGSS
eukprot:845823-Rhodomonas_salina.1